MTPEQKYSKIMEVMSDKTLSRGLLGVRSTTEPCEGGFWESYGIRVADVNVKIIGHPIHIGDVLHWIYEVKYPIIKNDPNIIKTPYPHVWINDIFELWKDKRLPLSPTDEELVDYIYTLVSSYQH